MLISFDMNLRIRILLMFYNSQKYQILSATRYIITVITV